MRAHKTWVPFLLTSLLSLFLVACFGGHGGGGGGGGNGGTPTPKLRVDFTGGPFTAFQHGASYALMVRNKGDAATSGTVTLVDPPTGMTVTSIAGANWTCTLATTTCSRSDSLAPGASYDPITVTGNVTVDAGGSVSATVTVTGGGAATFSGSGSIPVNASSNVSILFGQYAFLFSGFDANGAVAVTGSINVNANGKISGEEDFKDPKTQFTAQFDTNNSFCQNLPVPATGSCTLTAGGKTVHYDFVLRNNGTVARFFEDPGDGPSNAGSGILIAQEVPSPNALTSAGGFNGYFSVQFMGMDGATPAARIGIEGNIFTNLNGAIVTQNSLPSQADVNDNGTLIQPANSTTPNVTGNFTPANPTVDANGRATMTMTICTAVSSGVCNIPPLQRVLTLAVYIVAPVGSTTSNNPGRAFAIDITPVPANATSQVLSGQFFWQGNPPPTFDSSSISGVNVFAAWGVVPGSPAGSNTSIGILNATTSQLLFDTNNAGKVNAGGVAPPALTGTWSLMGSPSIASNGRAQLSATVGSTNYTFILYLDAANDGNLLGATVGGSPDTTVSFGFFTGQVSTSKFNNTNITGTYVAGTSDPVLPAVPNLVSPLTLTPGPAANSGTFSGASGSVTGNYSFDPSTGRGTALASPGKLFQNSNAVFYIITPHIMVLMGADQGETADAIGLIQF